MMIAKSCAKAVGRYVGYQFITYYCEHRYVEQKETKNKSKMVNEMR